MTDNKINIVFEISNLIEMIFKKNDLIFVDFLNYFLPETLNQFDIYFIVDELNDNKNIDFLKTNENLINILFKKKPFLKKNIKVGFYNSDLLEDKNIITFHEIQNSSNSFNFNQLNTIFFSQILS